MKYRKWLNDVVGQTIAVQNNFFQVWKQLKTYQWPTYTEYRHVQLQLYCDWELTNVQPHNFKMSLLHMI